MFYRNGIIAEYIINEQRTNSTGLPYHNSIDEMKWDVNILLLIDSIYHIIVQCAPFPTHKKLDKVVTDP